MRYVTDLLQSVQGLQNELADLDQALEELRSCPHESFFPQPNAHAPESGRSNERNAFSTGLDPALRGHNEPMSDRDRQISFEARNDLATTTDSLVSLSKMNDRGLENHFDSRLIFTQILGTDGKDPYATNSMHAGRGSWYLTSAPDGISTTLSTFMVEHADALIGRYEDCIHTKYPFLDMSEIRSATSKLQANEPTRCESTVRSCIRLSTLMVMAVGLNIEGHDIHFSKHFESLLLFSALSEVAEVMKASPPLEEIHVTLLFAIFSLFNPSIGSTWHYVGISLRTCIAQGYYSKHTPRCETENAAKRAFWSCFSLAQDCSHALGRPEMLQVADISVVCYIERLDHVHADDKGLT